jgi:hypothetical protein
MKRYRIVPEPQPFTGQFIIPEPRYLVQYRCGFWWLWWWRTILIADDEFIAKQYLLALEGPP